MVHKIKTKQAETSDWTKMFNNISSNLTVTFTAQNDNSNQQVYKSAASYQWKNVLLETVIRFLRTETANFVLDLAMDLRQRSLTALVTGLLSQQLSPDCTDALCLCLRLAA